MAHSIAEAARQKWPPFVLVAGLLAIGAVLEATVSSPRWAAVTLAAALAALALVDPSAL